MAQHIRGLEADLGATVRAAAARPGATDEGRAYVPNIRRAFDLISEATLLLRPEPARLTISVTPSFATKWLIPRLQDFVAHNPLVDLRVLASESLSSFQADGVDIAVRQGRPPFGAGLIVDLLFPQQIIAICCPTLPPTGTTEIAAAEIQHHVLLHDAHNLWPEFMEKAVGLKMTTELKRMRFNQTSLAIDAAIAGQGIALASRFLVAADLAAGRLVQPVSGEMRGTQDFYVVMPRKQRHPEPTQAVRQWLLDAGECTPV